MITFTKKLTAERFTEVIAALFILLFVYTACSKLLQYEQFKGMLSKSPLISQYSGLLSIAIPITELIIAMLLFFPRTRREGLILSLLLMMLFTIYIAYMMLFSSHLPCSCGGIVQKLSWKQHLFLNLFLIVIAATTVNQHKVFIAINRGNRKPVEQSRH